MAPSISSALPNEIAWIAPRWPFPADDGAKIASERLLRPLTRAGRSVHLLSILPVWDTAPVESPLALASQRVLRRGLQTPGLTRLSSALFSLASGGEAYPLISFSTAALRRDSAAWLARLPATAPMVLDGLHVAGALDFATASRWVYRAHNVEWRILNDAAKLFDGLRRRFLLGQAQRLRAFEARVVAASRLTLAVSRADAEELRSLAPRARVDVLPIGADFSHAPNFTTDSRSPLQLLFVGRLDWEPNRDGLLWFLREVWPTLDAGRFQLSIVGSGSAAYLEEWRGRPGIEIKGRVEQLDGEYARAHLCLVPLRWASGTRVKIIEAAQMGRAVLSTAAGSLGLEIPAQALLHAETAAEWKTQIEGCTREALERQSRLAWEAAALHYGEAALADRFEAWLE
jgi:glycosyltransferase involved in cell wall biosynthesis